ncbi:hypothetical protein EV421DRAFT_1735022 [Armillaria borealis]|uniref:Uncharacterized protein n=1 Tax=Armillaria borealis TaxID=47425 RepID=A0AA39JQL3_9AGAR|nr:hypothetical protein EV421DRAFT_1735022 [Armillaria borealis]
MDNTKANDSSNEEGKKEKKTRGLRPILGPQQVFPPPTVPLPSLGPRNIHKFAFPQNQASESSGIRALVVSLLESAYTGLRFQFKDPPNSVGVPITLRKGEVVLRGVFRRSSEMCKSLEASLFGKMISSSGASPLLILLDLVPECWIQLRVSQVKKVQEFKSQIRGTLYQRINNGLHEKTITKESDDVATVGVVRSDPILIQNVRENSAGNARLNTHAVQMCDISLLSGGQSPVEGKALLSMNQLQSITASLHFGDIDKPEYQATLVYEGKT